jgi:DNA-binding transcriptional LysR family regulator
MSCAGAARRFLRVALDSACPFELIIPKIQEAVLPFGALELDFQFGVITQSLQAVLDDEAELAIAPLLSSHEELESRPLFKQTLLPSIHRSHLRNTKNHFELSELKRIPNIVVNSGQKSNPFGVPGLRGGKSLTVSNHAVKEQLILAGIGWGRIPQERLESRPYADELVPILRKELPPVLLEIAVIWKRGKRLGRAARAVRDKLDELALKPSKTNCS